MAIKTPTPGSSIRATRTKIQWHEKEIAKLRRILDDAGLALRGDSPQPRVPQRRRRPIQQGSSTGRALRVLREAGKPMHIKAIIAATETDGHPDEVQKPTLLSNISRLVRAEDTFTRVSPSVYGLREFDSGTEKLSNNE